MAPRLIVTGPGRSGTTLLWRLLCAAGLDLAYEPYDPTNPEHGKEGDDGYKQVMLGTWMPEAGWFDYPDRVILLRRTLADVVYSMWRRTPKHRASVQHYRALAVDSAKRSDQILHDLGERAVVVHYDQLTHHPGPVMENLGEWLGYDLSDWKKWRTVQAPEWAATAQYRSDRIVWLGGRWERDPEFVRDWVGLEK